MPGPFYIRREGAEHGVYSGKIRGDRQGCSENGYPVPEWQEIGPTLRVIVYPHPEAKEITPHVTPHVAKLLSLCKQQIGREQLQIKIGVKDRKYFYKAYLKPALAGGFIEYTIPEKPKSKLQQYRLTQLGLQQLRT